MAIYESYQEHRDKFEIISIHDNSVKSFAELDPKLVDIKKKYWQGKDLPFPILLDTEGKSTRIFGVMSWPTCILIDPEGRVVDQIQSSTLESKLPKLPASKMWARNRDTMKNVAWSYSEKETTANKLAEMLPRWVGTKVIVDDKALKTMGIKAEDPWPCFLKGGGISLRSQEEILLAPFGLGFVPTTDDKDLMISKKEYVKSEPSDLQKSSNEELNKDLNDKDSRLNELAFENTKLGDALAKTVQHFHVSLAVDSLAIKNKTIDLSMPVSGKLDPKKLGDSLKEMLGKYDLSYEVKSEVVWITKKK